MSTTDFRNILKEYSHVGFHDNKSLVSSFSSLRRDENRQMPVWLRLRPSSPLAPREESRIAAEIDWHLKALMNRLVNGNSAFFSRSEKATFAEILKLDSFSWAECEFLRQLFVSVTLGRIFPISF